LIGALATTLGPMAAEALWDNREAITDGVSDVFSGWAENEAKRGGMGKALKTAGKFALDNAPAIIDAGSAVYDEVSSWGWAEAEAEKRKKKKSSSGLADAASWALDNADVLVDAGSAVADVAGDAWNEVSSWGWAENQAKNRARARR